MIIKTKLNDFLKTYENSEIVLLCFNQKMTTNLLRHIKKYEINVKVECWKDFVRNNNYEKSIKGILIENIGKLLSEYWVGPHYQGVLIKKV